MALGSGDDDDGGMDDDDDDHLEGSSGVSGDELFNRCINVTLEAQEVRHVVLHFDYILRSGAYCRSILFTSGRQLKRASGKKELAST